MKCPECGKEAVRIRTYPSGERAYIHEEIIRTGPFPHVEITKSCFVAIKVKEGDHDVRIP